MVTKPAWLALCFALLATFVGAYLSWHDNDMSSRLQSQPTPWWIWLMFCLSVCCMVQYWFVAP